MSLQAGTECGDRNTSRIGKRRAGRRGFRGTADTGEQPSGSALAVPDNGAVRYAILGTTQARRDDGTPIALGGTRLRALLTVLALHPGRVHTTGALIGGGVGRRPSRRRARRAAGPRRPPPQGPRQGRRALGPRRLPAVRRPRRHRSAPLRTPGGGGDQGPGRRRPGPSRSPPRRRPRPVARPGPRRPPRRRLGGGPRRGPPPGRRPRPDRRRPRPRPLRADPAPARRALRRPPARRAPARPRATPRTRGRMPRAAACPWRRPPPSYDAADFAVQVLVRNFATASGAVTTVMARAQITTMVTGWATAP